MTNRNDILNNLGVPQDGGPLAIAQPSPEIAQATIAARLLRDAMANAINYETLPLVCENFIASLIMDMFEQDELFTYRPGDEQNSSVIITTEFNRSMLSHLTRGPIVVVAFQEASGSEEMLGNRVASKGVNQAREETQALMDMASFRVTVMHQNRTIALFLGQEVRAMLAGAMPIFKEVFKVTKVYPPSLRGPGKIEELEDSFGTFIDLRLLTFPQWKQRSRPDYIRKIVMNTIARAGRIIQDSLPQDLGSVPPS